MRTNKDQKYGIPNGNSILANVQNAYSLCKVCTIPNSLGRFDCDKNEVGNEREREERAQVMETSVSENDWHRNSIQSVK